MINTRGLSFPPPFLDVLEQFLDDVTLSSVARMCKGHMLMCYKRAERLFSWGQEKHVTILHNEFIFPADPFLQMQCAKMLVCSNFSLDVKPIVVEEDRASNDKTIDNVLKTLLDVMVHTISFPFSFSHYMSNICFVSGRTLNCGVPNTMRDTHAVHICCATVEAKCCYAIQSGNVAKYKSLRPLTKDRLPYLWIALDSCKSRTDNVSIIIQECDLGDDGIDDAEENGEEQCHEQHVI